MQSIITIDKMQSLTKKELAVFTLILYRRKYQEIAMTLEIPKNSISYIINQIYKKLEIQKHNLEYLRYVWKISLYAHEQEKTKGRVLSDLLSVLDHITNNKLDFAHQKKDKPSGK